MSQLDVIDTGLQGGWQVHDATQAECPRFFEADVVIVGTGAGGGTAAEILSQAGLSVLMIEEGGLHSQKDFKMDELWSYGNLYQEAMSRTTADAAIAIMQGKSVGGSTTVNWTSSFRTPEPTLQHWATVHGVKGASPEELAPWFEDREKRLNISKWNVVANANNTVLQRGCEALGWDMQLIPRNVIGCWNLGYCGFGCPTNAKQSMLVTTIPAALDKGSRLLVRASVENLTFSQGKVTGLVCFGFSPHNRRLQAQRIEVRANHVILAAGSIGTPAILLRSDAPDPAEVTGKRTFLHPVVSTIADMPETIDPFHGAPQSIYSDEFVWKRGTTGPMGFKLEVPPLHPALAAGVLGLHGEQLRQTMHNLPNTNAVLALLRDGFHEESPGGQVLLKEDRRPSLDYAITDYLWDGAREAFLRMAEVQFAAGAKTVRLVHLDSPLMTSWSQAQQVIADLPMRKHRTKLFSAHVMGGCAMGEDSRQALVNSEGSHHHIANLSIMDGSVFPTSIGANPQLSIYGMTAKNATLLAARLKA
jgi:choline dehydrogenase-like flavoprotein